MKINKFKGLVIVAVCVLVMTAVTVHAASVNLNVSFGSTDSGYSGTGQNVTDVNSLFTKISDISNSVIWLLIGLAVMFIVWNAFQFIRQSDSTERATYRSAIIWGVIGLFVILSIWGLVAILSNTFGTNNSLNGSTGQASSDINSLILSK